MNDSNRPTTQVLSGASKVKIGLGNFSHVVRDQYNHYTTNQTIVQTQSRRKKGDITKDIPELSEFTEVRRGDISKDKDVCYSWRLYSNGKEETEASVFYAELNIAGSFGQRKFTVKTYRGRNAKKEWRRDFVRCSKDWYTPLFGYNKSSVPLLIFYGELVPISHVEAQVGLVGRFYFDILRRTLGCLRNELWMDPMKGTFCCGPVGPTCLDWGDVFTGVRVPPDVELLKEDVIIRYFSDTVKDDAGLLWVLDYCSRAGHYQDAPSTYYPHVISSLTESMIAFSGDVRWFSWKGCLHNRQKMPDGLTRFLLKDNQRCIPVESNGEVVSWLSQCLSVFHAHGIGFNQDLSKFGG
ncbi:hypothetical protein L218DRAFT_1080930 [Marasmius fiardii PR-910]|nr:hypothetical protein L218DRAFT_1080930 [Marasmius fiardii PR-910]